MADDINNGYLRFIKKLNENDDRRWIKIMIFPIRLIRCLGRIALIIPLFIYSILLLIYLKVFIIIKKPKIDSLYRRAITKVPLFIKQYPLHLYPVIAKAFEIAFIEQTFIKIDFEGAFDIAEFAIGDGTLSKKIFFDNKDVRDIANVYAFDLNPYSLEHANYDNISQKIVADCLDPPVKSVKMFVCNNLLHHITAKNNTLKNWSECAEYGLFNENTEDWSKSWAIPYSLNILGFKNKAEKKQKIIQTNSLQHLESLEVLNGLVDRYFKRIETFSFFNAKTFFLSSIFSFFLRAYGPPTPRLQKWIFNKIIPFITQPLTRTIASLLIVYDYAVKLKKPVFVSWFCQSKQYKLYNCDKTITLICPNCGSTMVLNQTSECSVCKEKYDTDNNMLFLLRKDKKKEIIYSTSKRLEREHL